MSKRNKQDIRSGVPTRYPASQPPNSAPRRNLNKESSAIDSKAVEKEWEDFTKGCKQLDDKKLNGFLEKASNSASQKVRWSIFFKHFIANAQQKTQQQMMTTLRYYNRGKAEGKKVDARVLLSCLQEISSKIEQLGDDFDVPKASEYYGYIISEFLVREQISPQDVITKFAPKKCEKETSYNLYMTGILRELSALEDPDGKQFVEKHANVLSKGFKLEPKDYGKKARSNKIPDPSDLPIIQVVFGENKV